MKKILAFGIILCGIARLDAQTKAPKTVDSNQVFTIVQQQPLFPGNISEWLGKNIIYPEDARKNNIEGTVYISFVVEKNGSISGAKVLRSADKELDKEGLRVVSAMPTWKPGIQNGHTVRVQYMVPIRFVLKDDKATPKKG